MDCMDCAACAEPASAFIPALAIAAAPSLPSNFLRERDIRFTIIFGTAGCGTPYGPMRASSAGIKGAAPDDKLATIPSGRPYCTARLAVALHMILPLVVAIVRVVVLLLVAEVVLTVA